MGFVARQNGIKITQRSVEALAVETGDAVFWDRELHGFGVRVYASGRKVYVIQTRGPTGRVKRVTIRHDVKVTAEVIAWVRRGEEPFLALPELELTMAERYMKAHVAVNCKPGTAAVFGRVIDLYILPELGALKVSAVERSYVSDLHFGMPDKPYQANQTVSVLAKMLKLAEAWGMAPPRRNLYRSVKRYREHRRAAGSCRRGSRRSACWC